MYLYIKMKSVIHAWYRIFVKSGVSYQEWLKSQPLIVKKLGSRPIPQTVRLGDIRPKGGGSVTQLRFLDREKVRELTGSRGARREIVLVAVDNGEYEVEAGRSKVDTLIELVGKECYVEVLVYE